MTRQPSRLSRRSLLKTGALLAAGAGTGATLSSCGGTARASGEPLQFWSQYAPTSQQDPDLKAQNDWFLEVIDGWNANNDQQIEPVFIPNYTDPSNTRVSTAFASNNGPDIFLISPGEFLRYYNGGVLEELTPYMTREAIDDFIPESMVTRSQDGRIYGLPMENEPLAIFYNIPAFEEAGLSEGDLPGTWEEMLELGRRLTGGEQAGLVFETVPGYYQNFTFYPWIWQGGGDVIDPATQQQAFESDAVEQALRLWGDAVRTGASPRTVPANGDLASGFTQGYAAMWENGIFQVPAMHYRAPDHPYGIFPLPTPPGGQRSTALGGWAWVVNNRGRNPEAAARFVVESIGSMSQESIDRSADWCGRAKLNLPARTSVDEAMQQLESADHPMLRQFREDIFPHGRAEPRYPPPVYKAVSNALQRVQLAGADPVAEADVANAAIEAFLETYHGGSLL